MAADDIMALLQQAVARHGAGDLDAADTLYRRVLAREPGQADALSLRSALLLARGALEEAHVHAATAVRQAPDQAVFHSRLGSVLMAQGRVGEAIESFSRAAKLDPRRAEAHNNLGILYRQTGDLERAEAALRAAIAANPQGPEAYCNLGGVLQERGLLEAARQVLEDALRLKPDYADAHLNLGNTLRLLEQPEQAEAHLRHALRLRPEMAEAHNSLGLIQRMKGEPSAAREAFLAALSLKPDYGEATANLELVTKELGLPSHGEYRNWGFDRDGLALSANRMVALLHDGALSADDVASEHMKLGSDIEAAVAPLPPLAWSPPRDRRVRIGLLSGNFRRNPAFYFTEPVLRCIDRGRFELFGFSHLMRPDAYTDILAAHLDHFHDITRMDDERAARLIRDTGVDILIVATGHFEGGRVGVAARAPAPHQVNFPSYPATIGLSRIAWRLSDIWCDPPGRSDGHYAERVLRVEGGHLCYAPPVEAPAVSPPPCLQRGHVTFASFNRLGKLTDAVLDVWAQILVAMPDSRLFLKTAQFSDPAVRQRIAHAFAARGIAPERLDLEPYRDDIGAHLADYARADIALDPFPYSGQTTTCEALWMGVPVIALAGDRYVARVCGALLTRIGHPELVAADAEQYCAIALELAGDPARLQALRAGMRPAMQASTLADPRAFAPHLAAALETIMAG